jgi:radical SAM superfamily enzyme YgiQ (UPF0313 family)
VLTANRKILLFSPTYGKKVFGPPLGLLSLAASLRVAGFHPVIIDGAVEPNYLEAIARETANCMAFGVSLLTGPVIRDAITASKLVRQLKPEIPIIFGGWHPTLLTSETLREPFVDVVVRHQGERTLTDILHHYQTGSTLDTVPGCWFKRDGKIYSNQDRPASPLTTLPPPAYDLVDFDVYARASGARKLPYATSIGCPYACNYCTDMVFYNRRFNPLDVAGVVRQIVELVERHRLDEVSLVDSNFLVNTPRALAIAREFIESGARFHWTFQASTDLLCRISDEDVCTLARSGVSHIGFGTESASPEVLRSMNKRHQSVPDMFEAARKCANAGIRVTYNLIFGYPGEEEWHRKQTLRVMGEIAERYHNVTFSPNVFTPYPGIPIWPELRALGLHEPTSLPEWASVGLGQVNLPWMNPASSKNTSAKLVLFPADKPASKDSTGIKKRHVAWT